jgi:hypothetical protein
MKYLLFLVGIFLISNVLASDYSITFTQFEDNLVVIESIDGNETSYVLENSLEHTSANYIFLQEVVSKHDFDNFKVVLNLDKNILVDSEQIYPVDGKILSNGEFLTLYWEYSNVSRGEDFAFFVVLRDNSFKIDGILYSFLFTLIFGVIIFLLFFLSRGRKKVEKYLLDEERKIIELLSHSDRHESWQRKIQSELNLSKAKTSRLIRNLEARRLIEKIPFGNTNKIRLK